MLKEPVELLYEEDGISLNWLCHRMELLLLPLISSNNEKFTYI